MDKERVQSFDIDHPTFDHVAIYRWPDGEYIATPFVREERSDGSIYYDEPDDWTADDDYYVTVLENAEVPTDKLRIHAPERVEPDDVEPL